MNIGIDINPLLTSPRTGVGEYTFELLNALFVLDKKNQYFLFSNSFSKNPDDEMWDQKNVHFIHTRVPNKIFHLFMQLTRRPYIDELIVKQYEKKNKVKIGHLDIFFSPNIGFSSLSQKCKKILTVHDLSFELFPDCFSLKMRLWHKLLRPKKQCTKAEIIFVPSENTKRDIVDIYNISPEKIHVLHLGQSEVFALPKEYSSDHLRLIKEKYHLPEKYILFLGTLEPRKNIENVIEAFSLFQQEFPIPAGEYTLVIAGTNGWKYKRIQKSIQKTKQVKHIGYVFEEDKPILYTSAALFVYPSFYEGFGLPVLEAMGSGVPVITSNRSSLPEITSGAAYLVDPHSVEEIKTGMERILFSEGVSHNFVQKGLVQAQKFDWNQTAQKFLDLLNE